MPPKGSRAKRGPSAEPPPASQVSIRQSRRTRSSQEPDDSPLRSLATPKRMRKPKSDSSAKSLHVQPTRAAKHLRLKINRAEKQSRGNAKSQSLQSPQAVPGDVSSPLSSPPVTPNIVDSELVIEEEHGENVPSTLASEEEHGENVGSSPIDGIVQQNEDCQDLSELDPTPSKSNSSIIYPSIVPKLPPTLPASPAPSLSLAPRVPTVLSPIAEETGESDELQTASGVNPPVADKVEKARRPKSAPLRYDPSSIQKSYEMTQKHKIRIPGMNYYDALLSDLYPHPMNAWQSRYDVKMSEEMRANARSLNELQKVDLIMFQRANVLELEEILEKFNLATRRKDMEIERLREDLAQMKQKEQKELETTRLQNKEKRRLDPADDDREEIHKEQRPARRMKFTVSPAGAISVKEDENQDNHLRKLLFDRPALPNIEESDSDGEGQDFMSRQIRAQANSLPNDPTSKKYQEWVRKRFQKFARDKERAKKVEERAALVVAGLAISSEETESESEKETQQERRAVVHAGERQDDYYMSGALSPSPTEHVELNTPPSSKALVAMEEQSQTPAPGRWGLGSIFGSVQRYIRGTPRTEPAPRIVTPNTTALARQTGENRSVGPQTDRQMPESPTPLSFAMDSPRMLGEPTTPIFTIGIRRESFAPPPQTAPQSTRPTEPAVPRRNFEDSKKRMREKEAKRRQAAEMARQAAENARQAAIEAEDDRLRKEAAELRRSHALGDKRKRVDDLKSIPHGAAGVATLLPELFDKDDEVNDFAQVDADKSMVDTSMVDAFTPPPAKKARVETAPKDDDIRESVKPTSRTFTPASKPKSDSTPGHAHVYTGTMFADYPIVDRNQEHGNIFGQARNIAAKKAYMETEGSPGTIGKKYGVWIAPKSPPKERSADFNYEGHFVVPDDTDSESDGDDSQGGTTTLKYMQAHQPRRRTKEQIRKDEDFMMPSPAEDLADQVAVAADKEEYDRICDERWTKVKTEAEKQRLYTVEEHERHWRNKKEREFAYVEEDRKEAEEKARKESNQRGVETYGNVFNQFKAEQRAAKPIARGEAPSHEQQKKTMPQSETRPGSQADHTENQQPPDRPTPLSAPLSSTPSQTTTTQSDSDALARARSQAEKYKPKTPSGLRAASKLATSPALTADGQTPTDNDTNVAKAHGGVFTAGPQGATGTQDDRTVLNATITKKQGDTSLVQPQGRDYPAGAQGGITAAGAQGGVVTAGAQAETTTPTTPLQTVEVGGYYYDPTSIEYAIALANNIPDDQLYTDMFTFPAAQYPVGWPPLDPEVEALLNETCQGPAWEKYVDAEWQQTWSEYLEKEGGHAEQGLTV